MRQFRSGRSISPRNKEAVSFSAKACVARLWSEILDIGNATDNSTEQLSWGSWVVGCWVVFRVTALLSVLSCGTSYRVQRLGARWNNTRVVATSLSPRPCVFHPTWTPHHVSCVNGVSSRRPADFTHHPTGASTAAGLQCWPGYKGYFQRRILCLSRDGSTWVRPPQLYEAGRQLGRPTARQCIARMNVTKTVAFQLDTRRRNTRQWR